MGQIGIPGLILILIVALVIFGPSKLPEIGKAVGSSLKEFKRAASGIMSDDESDQKSQKIDSKDKS
ncbi:twin-arginine translocase TatA/TatE family subunit [Salinibacillus xinjiangensis]|uniref:Sec-independent protein translocase protein TatA n=1 Tax=Salinibacillus xinjiangensis TaxID=1229268 RepID=A0A6G1XBF0_9BACI|nr:twin-arginine translocase TatA/TatE family subunit [Salinibacillus xinjiangensis]MRG88314.1 twin-arginine translocase TatA/TatE family subunit [Salinibacillus xinjiangensis]